NSSHNRDRGSALLKIIQRPDNVRQQNHPENTAPTNEDDLPGTSADQPGPPDDGLDNSGFGGDDDDEDMQDDHWRAHGVSYKDSAMQDIGAGGGDEDMELDEAPVPPPSRKRSLSIEDPASSAKIRMLTPFRDARSAFQNTAPHSSSTPSTRGASPFSSGASGRKRSSHLPISSQGSSTKGKSTQQKIMDIQDQVADLNDLGRDRMVYANERYSLRVQTHMRDKEIAYLQSENVNERTEAEKIRLHRLEEKKVELEQRKVDVELRHADALVLDKERDVLALKLQLAKMDVERAKMMQPAPDASN
ncbi:hypothetical protein EV363DRAFT_1548504, partial [Boletus edulis]